ncbi:hypothetical protein TESG_08429 [Trichophyton tonsurans CBS 112818]|uniref:Uncharacterized protein n=1 Tax=Trichophyton tonsurans (strain CBS 112818) TaxID=647933 RepID=F2RY16_TRIT1|nr:hypothetical protein TESG_08429 [Trichophyton tonsurans CBS 112818]
MGMDIDKSSKEDMRLEAYSVKQTAYLSMTSIFIRRARIRLLQARSRRRGKKQRGHKGKKKEKKWEKGRLAKCLILCFLPETASSLPRANYASQSTSARTNWLNSVFGLWGRGKKKTALLVGL